MSKAQKVAPATAKARPASKTAKAKWAELGTLRKNANGKSYLVLDKAITVLRDGEEVDLGEFRTVSLVDPMSGLEALLDGGHIDQDEYEKRVSFIEEKNIKYRLTVPPASSTEAE